MRPDALALILVRPDTLADWIAVILPQIKAMAEKSGGRFEASDIVRAAIMGQMQIWIVTEGAKVVCVTVTEFRQYPRLMALGLIGIYGHGRKRWQHLMRDIENWARERGCRYVEAMCEHAKFRHMLPGYEMDHVRMVLTL